MVKIVDMDQNSDAGDSDVEGLESQSQGQSKAQRIGLMGTDDEDERMDGVGNDRGAQVGDGGIGGGKRLGELGFKRERVKRWGVVLATAEALEGKLSTVILIMYEDCQLINLCREKDTF